MELKARRRVRDESLQALHADITRLMALAYQKEDSPLSKRIARDYFLSLLGDPKMKIKAQEREREPPNLQFAYKTGIWLEALKNASRFRETEAVAVSKEQTKPNKTTRAVQKLSEQLNLEHVEQDLL